MSMIVTFCEELQFEAALVHSAGALLLLRHIPKVTGAARHSRITLRAQICSQMAKSGIT